MQWLCAVLSQRELILWHNAEELVISLLCLSVGLRGMHGLWRRSQVVDLERQSRALIFCAGFFLLAASSLLHAAIHAFSLNSNMLYQTLLGYCVSLLLIIAGISMDRASQKRWLPLLYLPLVVLLVPAINEKFPLFGEFRPLVWVSVSYLAGIAGMLYVAIYHRSGQGLTLVCGIGFFLISLSSAFLFFPDAIGSASWCLGHVLRPFGFLLVAVGFRRGHLDCFGTSILFRALTAFSLLAAIPLLTFGTVVFYQNISPVDILGERMLVFLLLLVTLGSALIFAMGLIIRLIRPILLLKQAVDSMGDDRFDLEIPVMGRDEIGELSTAFNQMLSRLRQAIKEQERMCRLAATGELASTLAHEIKNPLNAINGAALYLKRNVKGSLACEFLDIIASEVGRINQLTVTLLSFSRPRQPELAPTDINRLVQSTLMLLDKDMRDQEITIVADLDPAIPAVKCDANQIKQILINLLINAADAVGVGGRVEVVSRFSEGKFTLKVRDNGKGIPSAMLEEIFHPFYTTKTRGTGLGLAISKTIAREHNGDLSVASVEGRGSTFTLILKEDHYVPEV